ncbi:olfactory receptor 4E1-like [Anguilla anguilla]|uniref:olfactory receptor 4E1-like n=1 Tax=Anguilla anguilla TaxID=7936 RepID=UPI0015A7607B|nr:olfactory receptor 4E1-like [Anguilla anguilla]XP_035241876.1 olfactory receptor 4E1-like [Anguilla anguilla]
MTNHSSLDNTMRFTSYGPFRPINYFFFTLTFLVYILSIFCNVLLMLLIYFDSSLHKPMYIFLFNLAVNGLIGGFAIWPKIMENLLSETQNISFLACVVQLFLAYFYMGTAYTTFSVMAYDRYVSICKPLQYHIIMTPGKVKTLLTAANIVPLSCGSIMPYLISTMPLCRYTIKNLFCDAVTLLNLSCVKSDVISLIGIGMLAGLVVSPCIIILLSYAVILNVSLKASKDAQKKALSTCSPHLITFVNFAMGIIFFAFYYRYNSSFPGEISIVITVDVFLIPPLLNPIIYGIRTKEIRKCFVKTVRKKERYVRVLNFFTVKVRVQSAPINVRFNDYIN